jgi:hypothetical protein
MVTSHYTVVRHALDLDHQSSALQSPTVHRLPFLANLPWPQHPFLANRTIAGSFCERCRHHSRQTKNNHGTFLLFRMCTSTHRSLLFDERGRWGRGDERGTTVAGGGDRPSFSITRLNLLSQFFACPIFFSTAIRWHSTTPMPTDRRWWVGQTEGLGSCMWGRLKTGAFVRLLECQQRLW